VLAGCADKKDSAQLTEQEWLKRQETLERRRMRRYVCACFGVRNWTAAADAVGRVPKQRPPPASDSTTLRTQPHLPFTPPLTACVCPLPHPPFPPLSLREKREAEEAVKAKIRRAVTARFRGRLGVGGDSGLDGQGGGDQVGGGPAGYRHAVQALAAGDADSAGQGGSLRVPRPDTCLGHSAVAAVGKAVSDAARCSGALCVVTFSACGACRRVVLSGLAG
jgi:hypothetical protein